jgi:hypothetical protein
MCLTKKGGVMPRTKVGKEVMGSMKKQYGKEKGENVFYGSIVKGKPGSEQWEGKKKGGTLAKAKATYAKKNK